MMGKDKLGFDVTDSDTIAASDSVGAYVRSSDGTLITHTDLGGGKKGLDVSFTAVDLDIRDLDHTQDSVAIGDGTHFLDINADGSLNITDNGGSLTVDAVDLDIRDLAFATDSVTAHQGGTWDIGTLTSITNDVNIADGGNSITVDAVDFDIRDLTQTDEITVYQGTSPWVVSATDLDIRDLTHASDSVKVGDGTDFWAIDGTGLGRVADYHTAAANAAISIDNTAGGTALVASGLTDRTNLFVQNNGNQPIYIGVGTVTAANGLKLSPGSVLEARIGAALALKAITANANAQDIRILQLA
jgi:hypothetical protein